MAENHRLFVTGTRGIPGIMGGVETHCEELFPRLVAMGYEVTKDEADAYLTELSDFELDSEALTKVAGGRCYNDCPGERYHCHSKQRSS